VTKKEIVKTISEEIGLTQLKTKEIVQKTFNAIVDTLVEEGRIELRNFGVFEVKKRAARKARNPRTGDRVDVPEKYVVTFKPGKEMEERVRLLEEQDRQARLARERAEEEAQQQASSPAQHAAAQPSGGFPSLAGASHASAENNSDSPHTLPFPSSGSSANAANPAGNAGESNSAENDDSAENNLRPTAL
jgi:nucleoid DNA-binding protein